MFCKLIVSRNVKDYVGFLVSHGLFLFYAYIDRVFPYTSRSLVSRF